MKLTISVAFLALVLGSVAAPGWKRGDETSCQLSVTHPDGTVTTTVKKRCPIPWTKNYGEYDEE